MKLTWVSIRNFRAIEYVEVAVYDFTSLIGQNNSCKSTVLQAIYSFLNQDKLVIEDWRVTNKEDPVIVEGRFSDIEDWERKAPGVAGIIQNNEIKLRATWDKPGSKPNYEAYIEQENIEGWSSKITDIRGVPYIKAILDELGFNSSEAFKVSANQEKIKQLIRDRFPHNVKRLDAKYTSENISIDPALKQALPNVEIVPAVRDTSDDSKPQSTTTFGKLLNSIILPAIQKTDEYIELMQSVEKLSKKVRGKDGITQPEEVKTLSESISKRITEIIEVKAILDIAEPDTEKFLGSSAIIRLDDGTETPIAYQGNGAQRALLFALIEALAKQKSESPSCAEGEEQVPVRTTILLFEEPELYLHPHLMRRLKDSLQKLSKLKCWQVIIATHSPVLIDIVDNPKSLVLLKRKDSGIDNLQLADDPFDEECKEALRASLDFHPTVNEAFFASRVVLVEGDTELAVLRHTDSLYSYFGIEANRYNETTIISAGGKWTLISLAKVLSKFKIPFRVIHDKDAMGRSEDELSRIDFPLDPYLANKRIADACNGAEVMVIDDTFEDILWERNDKNNSISKKDKPYKAWKKVKEIRDSDQENCKLKEIFEYVYNW